jgi:hydroxyacylglutathione hydrolase
LRLHALLITHHHADHIGGISELVAATGAIVFAPDEPRIPRADRRVRGGDRFRLDHPAVEIEVIAVPGHTRSHIAYRIGEWLFCGDALFSLGCGRLFEGEPATALESLDRLAALPGGTRVCCAHEYTEANGRFARAVEPDNPERERWLRATRDAREAGGTSLPSTLALERQANPFLRLEQPALRAAVATRLGRDPSGRLETFATLRAWKDVFT